MKTPRTAAELLREGEARLKRSPAIDHWPADRERREASVLLSFVLGDRNGSEELSDPDRTIGAAARERYRRLIRRRAGGEPIAHILGWTLFRGLRLSVRPGAFVPRQSSESLVARAVNRLRGRTSPVAVDVATGIGPVALAVAHAVPAAEVHGTDISADAVRQARENARALGLSNAAFHRGDLFAPLPADLRGEVDVITLHPPYVPRRDVGDLPIEVRGFEPEDTLTDFSPDGLGLLERTASQAPAWLRPGGWLLVEVSPDRARSVRGRIVRSGYRDVVSTRSWPDITRVIVGRV
ncbi:MAG: N5-glutamine methyltransferase family protein [Actinomycetota bacterium]